MWRQRGEDAYKISDAFEDDPLELSHYLLIRTRELLFLTNKCENKLKPAEHATAITYDMIM